MELSRATLGRWTGAVAELLEPLYDVLRQYVLMPGKVHADDIPVPVQSRAAVKPGQPGCGSTSVMTVTPVHRCPGGLVRVQSGPERYPSTKSPPVTAVCFRPMLTVVTGRLYESGRITEAACMAHARRKIHDVHARAPTYITTEALQRIGELYAIEAEVRGCSAEQRLAARKARAAPTDAVTV